MQSVLIESGVEGEAGTVFTLRDVGCGHDSTMLGLRFLIGRRIPCAIEQRDGRASGLW